MANEKSFDAVVIGSGPGGYVCGIRLGQLGVKAAVIEREFAGGVCLNVGCIPSKALIHAAKMFDKLSHADELGISVPGAPTIDMVKLQEWKSGIVSKLTGGVKHLLKGNSTEFISGNARLEPGGTGGHRIVVEGAAGSEVIIAKNVIVATGSRPIVIPGFDIDGERVIDSTGALALDSLPERMVVIGGGYIGLELGTVYAKLGTKVIVVEAMPSLLSGMDKDCVKVVARKLGKMGVEVMLNTKAKSWTESADGWAKLTVEAQGGEATLDTDKILLSIGRRPNSEGVGLEDVGVVLDERGFIKIDDQLRTNVGGIYAIGDVAGGMLLAHKASKEAEIVAEVIAGHRAAMDNPHHARRRLYRSRDRKHRLDRGRGSRGRPRNQSRKISVCRSGARALRQRYRRLHQDRCRRQDRRDSRHTYRRQRRFRPDQRGRARDRNGSRSPRHLAHGSPAPNAERVAHGRRGRDARRGHSHHQQTGSQVAPKRKRPAPSAGLEVSLIGLFTRVDHAVGGLGRRV